MSGFEFNVITSDGAALIAQATAANPIVLIGALSSANAASSKEDLASKTRAFYEGKGGSIFSSGATDNTARVIMSFDNDGLQSPQAIKSACILGKLHNQSDSQAVILAAISDDNSQIVIPDGSAPLAKIHVPINITINTSDDIATVGAQYVAPGDLDRFVSAHIAGNAFSGDAQDIYGAKTFKNTIISGSGGQAAISKNSGNFSTFYGGFLTNQYQIGGQTYDVITSDIQLNDGTDYHQLLLDSELTSAGYTRKFGLVSSATVGPIEKLAQINTFMDKDLDRSLEFGRVELSALEPVDGVEAKIQLKTDKTPNGHTYINLDAHDITLNATLNDDNLGGAVNITCDDSYNSIAPYSMTRAENLNVMATEAPATSDGSGYSRTFINMRKESYSLGFASASEKESYLFGNIQVDGSNNITLHSIEPRGDASVFNLGSSSKKFSNIYANYFKGDLDGKANIALNDLDGNEIQDYILSVGAVEGGSPSQPYGLNISNGKSQSNNIDFRPITRNILCGLPNDSNTNTGVGHLALVCYQAETNEQHLYQPGTTIPGSKLVYAGFGYENGVSKLYSGSTALDGTWTILSIMLIDDADNTIGYALAIKTDNAT